VAGGHFPAQPGMFSQHELLGEAGAPNVHAGTNNYALARSAELSRLGWGEGARVEPPVERPRSGVGVLQDVRPDEYRGGRGVVGEINTRRVVARPEGRQELAGLHSVDAREIP